MQTFIVAVNNNVFNAVVLLYHNVVSKKIKFVVRNAHKVLSEVYF